MVGLIATFALLAALVGAPAAQAACGGVEHFWPPKPRSSPPPLVVGDSVTMGAIEPLQRAGFEIDARGCRQMSEGLGVLSSRRRSKSLPSMVVVALGNNATITVAEVRRGLRILGSRRVLGMVTPRGAMASARSSIRAAGRRWPARVKVLDWAARSTGKAWTWDGLHLTPAGARGFASLLRTAYGWELPGTRAEVEDPEPDGGPGGGAVAPPP